MGFFEDCVASFSSMDQSRRSLCDAAWSDVSLDTQQKKLSAHGIHDAGRRQQIIEDLKKRPAFLVHVCDRAEFQKKSTASFVEVGTAQGMQSVVFSRLFPSGDVHTCDIKDERVPQTKNSNVKFHLGDSLNLYKNLVGKTTFDFCWIDGSHDHYAVVEDFLSLFPLTGPDTIWAFDDFDNRFGCYYDLQLLMRHFDEKMALELGQTASGNPNRILLARGFGK